MELRTNEIIIIVCAAVISLGITSCKSAPGPYIIDTAGPDISQTTNNELIERNERLANSLDSIQDIIKRAKNSAQLSTGNIESALIRLDQLEQIISDITRQLEDYRTKTTEQTKTK